MLEGEMVNFYTGLFKLVPSLPRLEKADLIKRLTVIVSEVYGITLTRDHVVRALELYTGNRAKRRWDLKFEYGVRLFLDRPNISHQEAHDVLKSLFSERTRPGVIESMQNEAEAMKQNEAKEYVEAFKSDVLSKFAAKNKDASFFPWTTFS